MKPLDPFFEAIISSPNASLYRTIVQVVEGALAIAVAILVLIVFIGSVRDIAAAVKREGFFGAFSTTSGTPTFWRYIVPILLCMALLMWPIIVVGTGLASEELVESITGFSIEG